MDWFSHMNSFMDYIEPHLKSNIDYAVFDKMLCCSTHEFSRIFVFIASVPISEYIRQRRLLSHLLLKE